MVNDFTKEELQDILETYQYIDETEGSELELRILKKLKSMIENYCEHKTHGGEIDIFVDVCKDCDALLLRNKTLGEHNE